MTQQEVANLVGISLRSYKSYENDEEKQDTIKYNYIVEQLSKINYIDEETGILELEDIVRKCSKVFDGYYDAMKSQFRQVGNHLTETGKSSIITASLLA